MEGSQCEVHSTQCVLHTIATAREHTSTALDHRVLTWWRARRSPCTAPKNYGVSSEISLGEIERNEEKKSSAVLVDLFALDWWLPLRPQVRAKNQTNERILIVRWASRSERVRFSRFKPFEYPIQLHTSGGEDAALSAWSAGITLGEVSSLEGWAKDALRNPGVRTLSRFTII